MANRITNKTTKEINPIDINDLSLVVFDKGNENPYKFPTKNLIDKIQETQEIPSLEDTINENPLSTLGFIVGTNEDSGTSIQQEGIGGIVNGSGTWGITNETGEAVFSSVSNINGVIKPYKSYTINVSQAAFPPASSVNVVVLENNLSGNPIWSRNSAGSFSIILEGAFTINTWFEIHMPPAFENDEYFCDLQRIDNNTCNLRITNLSGTPQDGFKASIEIRVYN